MYCSARDGALEQCCMHTHLTDGQRRKVTALAHAHPAHLASVEGVSGTRLASDGSAEGARKGKHAWF